MSDVASSTAITVFTIGHSNRSGADFLALLRGHAIARLFDVRTVPKSRHNPQFGQDQLAPALDAAGIVYEHLPSLGGLRKPRKDSVNGAWRNDSFRGYADHMATADFQQGLARLIECARTTRTVIMCAEAVPWRCHRSLVADALLARGIAAEEITSPSATRSHRLTPFAHVEGTVVTYPALV